MKQIIWDNEYEYNEGFKYSFSSLIQNNLIHFAFAVTFFLLKVKGKSYLLFQEQRTS